MAQIAIQFSAGCVIMVFGNKFIRDLILFVFFLLFFFTF